MNEHAQNTGEPDQWETDFRQWGQRPQPELRPFFYTRLRARFDQSVASAVWLPFWLRRPAYAYAAFALLVLLNAGVVVGLTTSSIPDDSGTTATAFQDEYVIDSFVTAYE